MNSTLRGVLVVLFWCCFFQSVCFTCCSCLGAKYHKAGDSVRVILRDGTIKHLETLESNRELSEDGQEMCQYVAEVWAFNGELFKLKKLLISPCC